jgi:hypothetical protein
VWASPLPRYEQVRAARRAAAAGHRPISPEVTAAAILRLVDAPDPPLRLFLGTYPFAVAEKAYAQRMQTWNQWRELAASADDAPPGN